MNNTKPKYENCYWKGRLFWQFRDGEFCYDIQISLEGVSFTGGRAIRAHVLDQENFKFMGTNPFDTECVALSSVNTSVHCSDY
jgi:hypothetical protein